MLCKKLYAIGFGLMACTLAVGAMAAVSTTKSTGKQSAIQNGTKVRTRVAATGVYDQECYDAYYGCMDQFCITDNSNGGSCACSDDNAAYEKRMVAVQDKLTEAERISTEEVEKVKAGANADIIFSGTRKYDADGNILGVGEQTEQETKAAKRQDLMSLFETNLYDFEDSEGGFTQDIAELSGGALFSAADALCAEQLPDKCAKDLNFLHQVYARQIVSDCKGFENALKQQEAKATQAIAAAEIAVRNAQTEMFNSSNKYDLGQCMVAFKKCMQTEDACGKDWENCVFTIASENMQNNTAKSVAKTKIATTTVYDITASTMEILNSKRTICENVLANCVAVRDNVWPAFLRESAPTIKLAESRVESKFRQSCLTDISNCIQKACRDDIAGRGTATMDACLSRPDMARSFCKVEIDPCERMEPQIWDYVVDKLAAMRVDACTAEVKECFTDDTRCGENFQNCIGMDYDYIHDICPLDKLVVCKQARPGFSMDDLDSMLMGLYLNIDNAALENCQNLVDKKMLEICGSTSDCNKFAGDTVLGTGSLHAQKDGSIYRVTGMISFGSIKMGSASSRVSDDNMTLAPGEIGIEDYLAQVRSRNSDVANAGAIISSVEEELNNIAGTINRTIELIEQDPQIQFCVTGRNLEQITGRRESTTARFPNLLNQVKMQIAAAALRQAQDNYNTKLTTMLADASKNASADVAQYMCQMLPHNNGVKVGVADTTGVQLATPYAISYDVGMGVDDATLRAATGRSSSQMAGASMDSTAGASKAAEILNAITITGLLLSQDRVKVDIPGGTREMWSLFNRDSRICHYCTSTVSKSCNSTSKKGFFGIGAKKELNCEESAPVEKCEDIPM